MIDPQSPSFKLVGAILGGRYRLVRLLGEGGMGAVFEADGLRGEGKRAVKLLHPEFAKEETVLTRFLAEAQANQALHHPNIAKIFEASRAEDGTPFLVMELLQGQSLADVMEQRKTVTQGEAVQWMQAVLSALASAHAMRIVHRDLKPDNLYLTRDASGQVVPKVLDFGIAKIMDAAGGMGSKTRTGVLLGTPGYMSPEQIKNSKAVDPRSDLWSVGVILYELLAGRAPFHADNEFTKLTAVLTETPTPIEQVAPHLAGWSGFFRRALGKEPNERFQSASEMAQALQAVTGAPPPSQYAPGSHHASHPPPSGPPGTQGRAFTNLGGQPSAATVALSAQELAPAFAHAASQPPAPPAPGGYPPAGAPHLSTLQGAGQAQRVGSTHVSGERPPGVGPGAPQIPSIAVVEPPPLPKGAPYWMVAVIGAVCLGLGFVLGLVAGK